MHRKLILYIATSLDGFIAAPNDDLSFLSLVEKNGEDYGYHNFVNTIDTVILGKNTYDWVLKNAGELSYPDKQIYVITTKNLTDKDNVKYYNGDLKTLVKNLKQEDGKNIFCDGGANIVNQLLKDELIDEFVISIIPILLGNGTRLYQDIIPTQKLELIQSKVFEGGLVQLWYRKN